MKARERTETFPDPDQAGGVVTRTCRECRHTNVNPPALDREQGLGAGIWRCRRCGAVNVEAADGIAEPEERFHPSSEKPEEEARTYD